jgi:hypothetical protein
MREDYWRDVADTLLNYRNARKHASKKKIDPREILVAVVDEFR